VISHRWFRNIEDWEAVEVGGWDGRFRRREGLRKRFEEICMWNEKPSKADTELVSIVYEGLVSKAGMMRRRGGISSTPVSV